MTRIRAPIASDSISSADTRRSVAKAPRMSFRLERRRPPPTVPSRTLVCRYLSAPESTMPLVKYSGRSGCRVSVLAAARSPLAEPGPFAANLARSLHKWARIMAANPPLLDRVARVGLGPAVPQPGESLPGSAPALSSGPLPGSDGPADKPWAHLRPSLRASLLEGAAAEVFAACAGGGVLTAWALHLGAS